MDDKLEKMMEVLQTLCQEIKEVKCSFTEIRNENKWFMENMREMRIENEIIKNENEGLKKEIKQIKERLERIENINRRKNIVLQGLPIKNNDHTIMKEEMENFMEEKLNIDIKIKSVKKLGNKTCLIELENENEKVKVMKNKSKLRRNKREKIFINDDMSKEERLIQGKIRKKAQEEKNKGKTVRIGFQKLVIDNEEWRWDNEREDIIIYNKDMRKNGNTKN